MTIQELYAKIGGNYEQAQKNMKMDKLIDRYVRKLAASGTYEKLAEAGKDMDATRIIRDQNRPDAKTIPILALTANAFDEDVRNSLEAGMNAHMAKPVDPDVLFDNLRHLVPEHKETHD